jgi:hypothetical protein
MTLQIGRVRINRPRGQHRLRVGPFEFIVILHTTNNRHLSTCSNMSPTTYPAVVYENKAEEPLLEKEPESTECEATFSRFHNCSLALGLLVGVFIQLSTLGANYLIISLWGEEFVAKVSQRDIVVFSLAWSLITSTMAMIVLAVVRNTFSAVYKGEQFDDIILHLECRFVVGALIGVCTAWAATDAALGMTEQVVYSFATLAVALGWCRFMMWFFASSKQPSAVESDDDVMYV